MSLFMAQLVTCLRLPQGGFGKGEILRLGFRKTGWHIAALTLEQMCRLFYLKRATEYLTGRPQFVRMGSVLSDVVVSDTGAPQGTVLSPFLFTLYTTDFQYNTGSCHLQKFSDDSAVVGCISEGQEEEYRALVDNFVEWTGQNHLQLNISKTREMVMDFRKKRKTAAQPLRILGKDVEAVEDYKYLGVTINHRLDWRSNTEAVYKKGMSRLSFLRKLRSFNMWSKMLEIF